MGRWLIGWLAQIAIKLFYFSHQAEGLNILFLMLPSRYIIPTLRRYGAVVGDDVEMSTPVTFHNMSAVPGKHYANLKIGDHCYFGKDVFLDLADKIEVEEKVTISMRAILLTHTHAGKSPLTKNRMPPTYSPVRLRRGCYIGAGAILLPGIEIGENAIVGAGAVVTHDVGANDTVVGIPATSIKSR